MIRTRCLVTTINCEVFGISSLCLCLTATTDTAAAVLVARELVLSVRSEAESVEDVEEGDGDVGQDDDGEQAVRDDHFRTSLRVLGEPETFWTLLLW